MSNRIVLISTAGRQEQEKEASAALSPGHLIETLSTSKVQKHSTEGGLAERHFATEDALQGRTKDDAYATDDKVMSTFALPGDVINALIGPGPAIVVGTVLISGGDGTLIAEAEALTATTVADRVAIAIEAIDLSATAAVATHAAVRVL